MKLVVIQKDINNKDYLGHLEDIAELRPDLVCLGELATSGCLYDGGETEDIEALSKSFEKFDFGIFIGMPREVGGQFYNAYSYIFKGKIDYYHKINLFEPMNETKVYQSGEEVGLFETKHGRVGVAICYDLRFPEIFQKLKEKGADIILVPAAFPRIRISAWRKLLQERAIETELTVVGINAVGNDGTNEFGGSSMVITPDGKVTAQLDEINESIIEIEL